MQANTAKPKCHLCPRSTWRKSNKNQIHMKTKAQINGIVLGPRDTIVPVNRIEHLQK